MNPDWRPVIKVSRGDEPPITIYLIKDEKQKKPYKLSCLFCKRTLVIVRGRIIRVVDYPDTNPNFNVDFEFKCKQCKQDWRFVLAV